MNEIMDTMYSYGTQ